MNNIIVKLKTRKHCIFTIVLSMLIISLIVGGYFVANTLHFGGVSDSTGYNTEIHMLNGISLIYLFNHITYLVLAGAGILFMASISVIKKFKLFWLIIASLIAILVYTGYSGSVFHGRYVDCLIPLLMIMGFAYTPKSKTGVFYGYVLSLLALIFLPLIWRDIINSATNIYTFLPVPILFAIIALAYIFLSLQHLPYRKYISILFIILLITFTLSNIYNYNYAKQSSDNAYNNCQIGRYIENNTITGITFDYNDYGEWWGTYMLITYYSRSWVPIGNESNSYFISSTYNNNYNILAIQHNFTAIEKGNGTLYLLHNKSVHQNNMK